MANPPERRSAAELAGEAALALALSDWPRARDLFAGAVARIENDPMLLAHALEGLANAESFLDDVPAATSARKQAYQLYRARDDGRGAARVALAFALEHYIRDGDAAVVRGWLSRSRRLLQDDHTSSEYAWLRHWEADVALLVDRDAARAHTAATEATALARELGELDLEMLSMALDGLSLVSLGRVSEGMRLLDESCATAVDGRVGDVDIRLTACCYHISACERARDHARAERWCAYVRQQAEQHSHRFMLSYCRTHYAGLLMASGDWATAERELVEAVTDLQQTKPPWAADAVCRLAELRRRQGRTAEAVELLERVEQPPLQLLGAPEGHIVRAGIALDDGLANRAAGLARRFLRRVQPDNRAGRVEGLELLVRACVAAGRLDEADSALAELTKTERLLNAAAISGPTALARGAVAVGNGDLDTAVRSYEDAVDHFGAAGLPYEGAVAHAALADVLSQLGRTSDAQHEARFASDVFRSLGAKDLTPAGLPEPRSSRTAVDNDAGLTPREIQVLQLLAVGRNNDAIADELVLSLRTIERHVSNVYLKIGVHGRIARAAAAAYAHRSGLVESSPNR